jgi:hypothetical protein
LVIEAESKLDLELFDDSPEEDELYGFELQDDLTEEQIELALKIANKWRLLRGIAIVTGQVGSGKDLFLNTIAYLVKRLFKNRTVHRDEKPRRLFGYYEPFNTITVAQELAAFEENLPKEISRQDAKMLKKLSSLAEQWLSTVGEKKLQGGVLCLTEFWRYMHNRNPFSPIGILLGGVVKRWRHMDLLLIGNAPKRHELDRFSCLPYVTTEVRCSWAGNDTAQYRIIPVRYVGSKGVIEKAGKPRVIEINGREPRELLDGKCYYNLFVSKSRMG